MVKGPRKPSKPLLTDDKAPLRSGRLTLRDPEQPRLLFDPTPDRVEPCLAVLKTRPPTGDEWSYDIKWDGYRIAIHRELSGVRILTRGGHDWTSRFPAMEGIIGKHRDRPYRSGKTGDWIKIKCVQRESFAIIGYELSSAMPDGFGSLLLGALKGGEYAYVGSVGMGFKHQQARALRKQLDKLKTRQPVVRFQGKARVETAPTLIAEIDFRGWTSDKRLRHASFKGLRDPEDAGAIYSLDAGDA